ncbi:uncharacterized protein, partial [Rutidosis leptorrhynchoides]|uniref:uncharacterized protein n=1 Tax=Rutidosis leptorrhynchoides TaxID=125765 RepID=UPI003A99D32C
HNKTCRINNVKSTVFLTDWPPLQAEYGNGATTATRNSDDDEPLIISTNKLKLKDYIEPLLYFTLTSSIEQTLDIDTGLTDEFCSNLLKDDEHDRAYSLSDSDSSSGVPPYPLYKPLASSALYKSILSGSVQRINATIPPFIIHEDSSFSLKQKECEWNKVILEKGSDLIKTLESVEFELHCQEPFFSQLKDGKNTVEGRCASAVYNRIDSGSLVLFNKCLLLQVEDVHRYSSFSIMLASEGLDKVLPGVETIKQGTQIYRKFYSEEKEKLEGVIAIHVKPPTSSQPCNYLAAILSALHYDGIQRLLGIAQTVGTIPDALPLPRSTLVSAFSVPHNPDVKSSVLSDGARALAKHVNRGNGKFWGSFSGNDSCKNAIALKVISDLIAHCCWINVHIVPPHGAVFEIRVQDGYGARWSLKPTKFIGFLEPYMEDGFTKGWKH